MTVPVQHVSLIEARNNLVRAIRTAPGTSSVMTDIDVAIAGLDIAITRAAAAPEPPPSEARETAPSSDLRSEPLRASRPSDGAARQGSPRWQRDGSTGDIKYRYT